MSSRKITYAEFQDLVTKPKNILQDRIIQHRWERCRFLMDYSIMYNHPDIVYFLLDKGWDLYDVEIFRKILGSAQASEYIDYYIQKGINLNDERFYKPIEVEDYMFNYENEYLDNDPNTDMENEPVIRYIYQPISYFTRNSCVVKKMIDNGLDIKKNVFDTEWGCLKRAIDYGEMDFVIDIMQYIDKDHLESEVWWCLMLNHVSQDGNVGKGAEKCYTILCEREKLLNSGLQPSRDIYDKVKVKWYHEVKEDPGEFRD